MQADLPDHRSSIGYMFCFGGNISGFPFCRNVDRSGLCMYSTFSSLITSLLRNCIPKSVRLIAQLVIIATLITIVESTLRAINIPIYRQLAVYIGLIITNCIMMERLEAFATAN